MKKVKKAYCYVYYKLYKWIGDDNFLADWKAELALDVLGIFLVISGIIYYTIFYDQYFQLGSGYHFLIGYVFFIAFPNYLIFHHNNQWRKIVNEFDKIPEKKNFVGGIIVLFFTLIIVGNMIYAYYQMSRIDWSQYR